MELRDIIAAKLEQKDWSQNYLAHLSGVTQAQISRILSGDTQDVRIMTLRAIAKALGCRTIDLLPPQDHDRAARSGD